MGKKKLKRRVVRQAAKKPKLGTGARFEALTKKLSGRRGKAKVSDPKAMSAWIGRKKYGKAGFAKLSAEGRKRAK